MLRCRNCQQPLTFAGITTTSEFVYQCTATVFYSDRDGRSHAVPCNPREDVFIPGAGLVRKEAVRWAKRGKKGDVQLPMARTQQTPSLDDVPGLAWARTMVQKLAALDELETRDPKTGRVYLSRRRQAAQALFSRPRKDGVVYAARVWRAA